MGKLRVHCTWTLRAWTEQKCRTHQDLPNRTMRVHDPAGIAWEAYQTMTDVDVFHEKNEAEDSACCVPTETESKCCV